MTIVDYVALYYFYAINFNPAGTASFIFQNERHRHRIKAVIQFSRRYVEACPPFMKELLTLAGAALFCACASLYDGVR